MLMVALSACGGADGRDSETKVPTETSSTTTSTLPSTTATTAAVTGCADLAAKALRLAQDARGTMRGIRRPTPEEEATLRAREQALRAEARQRGCPVPPGLSSGYVRERGS